ncbi:RTA1 like protein-domain-containing protein [Mycena sp. CBHHK59/15]|nr:RTA1 like protein-domain-containing protein [Mycena sp. CBHHK59/15]
MPQGFYLIPHTMTRHILRSAVLFALLASALAIKLTEPAGGFIPKKFPAIIALALYALSAIIHWIHFFRLERRPFMLTLTLGMTVMAAGFLLRIVFSNSPFSLGLYVIMDLLIVLAPCAFLATDYMLLARLAACFDEQIVQSCLLLRPSRITKVFVWSDLITVCLQGNGAGLAVSLNPTMAKIGNTIVMLGLCLQLASFALFTLLLFVFGWRVQTRFPDAWRPQRGRKPFTVLGTHQVGDWRILYCTMCITSLGILNRSVFRVAEYAGGATGFLAQHEGYFYLFDALSLWISMSLYCFVWPTRFLSTRPRLDATELRLVEATELRSSEATEPRKGPAFV